MNGRSCLQAASIAAVALWLGGCAFGQKITYSNAAADVDAKGDKSVAVATLDQRPYILDHDKEPSFVGLSRGGYGNPFDVETPTGAPLADEISESVSRALAARGFKSSVVKVAPSQSRHTAIEGLTRTGAERQVLIALKEWKSDKFIRTSLYQDVTVKVLDATGNEMATASFTSDEVVSDVPLAFRSKIESWFAEPKIVEALK